MNNKKCNFINCDREHYGRGYCRGHLQQLRRKQELLSLPKIAKRCKVENCFKEIMGDGYCNRHYLQYKTHGKILAIKEKKDQSFIIEGDVCYISLYNKDNEEVAKTVVDREDYNKIKDYRWFLDKDKYVVAHDLKKTTTVKLHRIIMNPLKNQQIDHKDRDKLNNRKENLRICNHSENQFNKKIKSSSGYKGVSFHKKRNKWVAQITIDKKHYNLGQFDNPIDAAKAYNEAALKHRKEFALINYIEK